MHTMRRGVLFTLHNSRFEKDVKVPKKYKRRIEITTEPSVFIFTLSILTRFLLRLLHFGHPGLEVQKFSNDFCIEKSCVPGYFEET